MPYRDMPIEPWMIDLIKALIQVRQHTRKDGTMVRAHQRNIMTHGEKKDLVSKMAAALAKHGKLDVSGHSAHHVHKAAAEVARQTGKHVVIHRDADGKLHVQHFTPGGPHMVVFHNGVTRVDNGNKYQEVPHHEAERALRVKKGKQITSKSKPAEQKVEAIKPSDPDHPGMLADPHLMTYAQYQQSAWSDLTGPTTVRSHKEYIRDALQAGKDVPAHVMDEHDGYGHQAKKEIEESRERVKNSERIAKERGWTTDSDYAGEKKMAQDEAKREKAAAKGKKPAPVVPEKPAAFSNPTHAMLQLIADHPQTAQRSGLSPLMVEYAMRGEHIGRSEAKGVGKHPAFGHLKDGGAGEAADLVSRALSEGLVAKTAGLYPGLGLTTKGQARLAELGGAPAPRPKRAPEPTPKVEPPAPAPEPKAKATKEAPATPTKSAREVTFDRPATSSKRNSGEPVIGVRSDGVVTHELLRGKDGWSLWDKRGEGEKVRAGMSQSEAMEYAKAHLIQDKEALARFHQHDEGVPLSEMPKQAPYKLKKVMNVSSGDGKQWHSDGSMASASEVNPRSVAAGVQRSDAIGATIEQIIPKQVAPVKPVAFATESKTGSSGSHGHVVFDNGAAMDARMYQHLAKQHPDATWHQDPSSTLTPLVLKNGKGEHVALAMPKHVSGNSNLNDVAYEARSGRVFKSSKPAPQMDPAGSLAKSWRFAGGGAGGGDA